MSETTDMRLETEIETMARSIREGVFPKALEPIMVPVFCKEKQLANMIGKAVNSDTLESLSIERTDWLRIINALSHFALAEYGESEDPSLKFGRALSELPALALAAGCHVGIKVTEAKK